MSLEVEEAPVGYPGFRVTRPPRLKRTVLTLKRVAWAKLSDVTMFSALFGEEPFLFSPWLTVFIDYGQSMAVTGVYSTDESSSEDEDDEPQDPRVPTVCLRKSVWDRELDIQQAPDTGDPRDYLTSGPQIKNTFVFTNQTTHPKLNEVMNAALTILTSGISVMPIDQRKSEWKFVDVDLADDRLNCRVEYSPLLTQSVSLESALPAWMDAIDEFIRQDGLQPDGDITLSVKRSVPEIVNAPLRSTRLSR